MILKKQKLVQKFIRLTGVRRNHFCFKSILTLKVTRHRLIFVLCLYHGYSVNKTREQNPNIKTVSNTFHIVWKIQKQQKNIIQSLSCPLTLEGCKVCLIWSQLNNQFILILIHFQVQNQAHSDWILKLFVFGRFFTAVIFLTTDNFFEG